MLAAVRRSAAVALLQDQFEGGNSRLGREAGRSHSRVVRTMATALLQFEGPRKGLGAPAER